MPLRRTPGSDNLLDALDRFFDRGIMADSGTDPRIRRQQYIISSEVSTGHESDPLRWVRPPSGGGAGPRGNPDR